MKWGLKGGFQLMQIMGLLGMCFDPAVAFVTSRSLFFRFALAILWRCPKPIWIKLNSCPGQSSHQIFLSWSFKMSSRATSGSSCFCIFFCRNEQIHFLWNSRFCSSEKSLPHSEQLNGAGDRLKFIWGSLEADFCEGWEDCWRVCWGLIWDFFDVCWSLFWGFGRRFKEDFRELSMVVFLTSLWFWSMIPLKFQKRGQTEN